MEKLMANCLVGRLVGIIRGDWLLLSATCVVLSSALLPVYANAATQNIYPNPLTTEAAPNSAVALDVMYDVSDADATLTGIGIRVHFDSTKLSFDGVDTTLAFGRLFNPDLVVAEADVSDFDGDPLTDQYLLLAWVDFAGNWPGALPEKLAAVHFVTAGDFTGSTTVRFSSSDLAGGYGFSSQPATVDESIVSDTFTVGGVVVGLANGESVTLQNNDDDNLVINSNGNFTFATPMQNGATYNVSVLPPPTCPSSTCFILNGNGTVSDQNVTNVRIVLSDIIFSDSFEDP
jgi:hypothetical protein